jgi:hypothetical protein
MGTLIDYDGKWTTKSNENVVILELCNNNNCVGEQSIVMTFLVRECYGSPKKQEF